MGSLRQAGEFAIAPAALKEIRADFDASRTSEDECAAEIARAYRESGVVLDPHTAVGTHVARKELKMNPATPIVSLATAHPAKFPDAIEKATGLRPELPPHLKSIMKSPERINVLPNDARAVAKFVRERAKVNILTARLTRLPSGLRIVTDANSALKTAAIGVFVGVGSRNEREGEHGLSHLLEHMAFKGTRTAQRARDRRDD